jgi:hypothetical protein
MSQKLYGVGRHIWKISIRQPEGPFLPTASEENGLAHLDPVIGDDD